MINWLIKTTLIFVLACIFTSTVIGRLESDYHNYQTAKGIALSNYLSAYQNIDILPEQARYFQVHINQYDISIEDIDMYITNLEKEAK